MGVSTNKGKGQRQVEEWNVGGERQRWRKMNNERRGGFSYRGGPHIILCI